MHALCNSMDRVCIVELLLLAQPMNGQKVLCLYLVREEIGGGIVIIGQKV
jgi:hypothetical protein